MLRGTLKILSIVLVSASAYAKTSEYQASFRANGEALSTVGEFMQRAKSLYENTKTSSAAAPDVEYRGVNYKALKLTTNGIISNSKVSQELTYILIHKGLWRMLYVESETCVMGQALEDGEWVKGWKCKPSEFPLTGALSDIFLVDNKEINLEALSTAWGRQVVVNMGAPKVEPKEEVQRTITLGDMKSIVLKLGGSWRVEADRWKSISSDEEGPALRIFVETKLGKYDISQNFLYEIKFDMLFLKEIDGSFCRDVKIERTKGVVETERVCDDANEMAYVPTSVTPFKMKLINTDRLTGAADAVPASVEEEGVKEEKPKLSCGNLAANYEMALRVHFERSVLGAGDIEGHRRAVLNLPKVLDPVGILFQGIDVESLLTPDRVASLAKALSSKGGDCSGVESLLEKLKTAILIANKDLQGLLNALRAVDYKEEDLEKNKLNPFQRKLFTALKSMESPVLKAISKDASLDVAAANLLSYYKRSLDLVHSSEELLTAAYLKQDAYSSLLSETLVAKKDVTLVDGASKKRYFGLSVASGLKGHYILSLHPAVAAKHNLKVGDVIKRVNGKGASSLSAEALDNILLDTSKKIILSVSRKGKRFNVVHLTSAPLDMMKLFYSLDTLTTNEGKTFLKIKISEFHFGLAKSLRASIFKALKSQEVDGYILDLQSNPGGNVDEALSVANFFIEDGVLSYYRLGFRNAAEVKPLSAKAEMLISTSAPLVVQVNNQTASSAEILAATLKAYKRGLIVGSQTFGKHVAQTYMPVELSSGRKMAMLITSTEYYDPNGLSLNGKGVVPDVVLTSKPHVSFDDGNREGKDYEVEAVEPFFALSNVDALQSEVVLDQTTADEIALLILSQ